jgi:hypothetical protein
MLTKHAVDWKDKVRIIAVSSDNTKKPAADMVNQKGWKLVEHYYSKWDPNFPLYKDFSI